MDKRDALNITYEYGILVSGKYSVEKIFLFGSNAKGTAHDDSDIDVAIVVKDYDDFFDIQLDLMKLTRFIDSRIEPHPFKLSDFNNTDPLADEVLKHGIEIYKQDTVHHNSQVAEEKQKYHTLK